MLRSSLYAVLVSVLLASMASCGTRGSTPPVEPPAQEVGAEDHHAQEPVAEAEAEPPAETVAEAEPLHGCCDRCEPGEECIGCRILGTDQPCVRVVATCRAGSREPVCVRDETNDAVWGGLTGEEIGEAYEVGGLGLVGTGEGSEGSGEPGGRGRGSGAGFGGKGKAVPRVRHEQPSVEGPLDREIIRRIVRAHINEVRACYDGGLRKNPELAGRVSIRFEIAADGSVGGAEVAQSTLSDASVGTCIAARVARWRFPKPPGGEVVQVTYPLALSPG